jgi:hypothetical protein
MRLFMTCAILAASLGAPLAMGDDPRQAGIAAADDSAVNSLMDQLDTQPLGQNLTVKEFIDRTGGAEELRAALARLEPVGGPRWLDDKTCQVRLEVTGTEIVADLANIAVKHADRSPIPANVIPQAASTIAWRWFTATGTSTSAGAAPPPPPDSPWAAIGPETRRRAIADAVADAAHNVLASVAGVELAPGHPVAEALNVQGVRQSLTEWVSSRPITAVDYRQNPAQGLDVQVTLSATPGDFFDTLRTAVTASGDVPHPADAAGWVAVHDQVIARMGPPIGHAAVQPGAGPAVGVILPVQPPDWTGTMADAAGVGGPAVNSLRAAREAEADAMTHIHQQVMALALSPSQTIGQAVQSDPRLARAVDRAILRGARLYKTEYRPDGTVEVRVSLDLRFLWSAISSGPG